MQLYNFYKKIAINVSIGFLVVFFSVTSYAQNKGNRDVNQYARDTLSTGNIFSYRDTIVPVSDIAYLEFSADGTTYTKNYTTGDTYIRYSGDNQYTWDTIRFNNATYVDSIYAEYNKGYTAIKYDIADSTYTITKLIPQDGLFGGTVSWEDSLKFNVSAAYYWIGGVYHETSYTQVTLSDADATYGRIDVIAVDTSDVVVVIEGTPSATPAKPTVDLLSQRELTYVLVPAGGTEPNTVLGDTITDLTVYDENVEWTTADNGVSASFFSTNDQFHGSVSAELETLTKGDYVSFTNSSSVSRFDYKTLTLAIKLKQAMTSGLIHVAFTNGGTTALVNPYELPIDKSSTGWQVITIPFNSLNWYQNSFDKIYIVYLSDQSISGMFLDYIKLQGGIVQPQDGTESTVLQTTDDLPEGIVNEYDKTVSITGGGINVVTGTYPDFTVTGTEVDGSTSNETITSMTYADDTLSVVEAGTTHKVKIVSSTGSTNNSYYNDVFEPTDSFSVVWPTDMSTSNYKLDIRPYYWSVIGTDSIQISVSVLNLHKDEHGFDIDMGRDSVWVEYFAVDTASWNGLSFDNYIPWSDSLTVYNRYWEQGTYSLFYGDKPVVVGKTEDWNGTYGLQVFNPHSDNGLFVSSGSAIDPSTDVLLSAEHTTVGDVMSLYGDGTFQLNSYGSGSMTGTFANLVGFDATGHLLDLPVIDTTSAWINQTNFRTFVQNSFGPTFSDYLLKADVGDSIIANQGNLTLTASQISDFDTEVSNNSAVAANTSKVTFPGFTSLSSDYGLATTDNLTQGSTNLYNQTHTGDVTGATALTIANDAVNDQKIDWGTGTNQVSTADVPEQTNLYYTEARVNANTNVASNSAFRTTPSSVITAGTGLGWTGNTLNFTSTIGDITSVTAGSLLDGGGTSGAVTLDVDLSEATTSATGLADTDYLLWLDGGTTAKKTTIANVLALGGAGSGSVTSVGLSAPTGFSVTGSPVTTSGTLALAFATGYSLPTTSNQTNWTSAYNDKVVSAAVSGTTTKTLTLTQQDAGVVTATWSALTGSGSSGRVSYWNGTSSMTSDADLTFDGLNLRVGATNGTGVVVSGNFSLSSDRRLKKKIRNLQDLSWVDNIDFKKFVFKADQSQRERYGVIAQQILRIKPSLVYVDQQGMYSVAYVDLLIAKTARQDQQIEELNNRVDNLEERLKALENEK